MRESKTRESNFELLRLICMAFVVAGHLIIHGIQIDKYGVNEIFSGNIAYILIYSIFIIAVNCFILISGYFSIKPSISGVTRLGLSAAFYGAVIYALFCFLGDATFNHRNIEKLVFPLSKSQYWFIIAYFQLYLISPLLNKATESFSKHEFKIFIMLFSVITFYLGYLNGVGINPNGYNAVNFMYLYVIARYIRLHTTEIQQVCESKKVIARRHYLLFFFTSALVSAIIAVLSLMVDKGWKFAFSYNSPFIILSAICFFLFIRSFSFKSKIVNWAASSCLAIYLIDDNLMVRDKLSNLISRLTEQYNFAYMIGIILGLTICICVSSIIIDKVRIYIMSPIETKISLTLTKIYGYFAEVASKFHK